jgi:large subunit ribosomal protein L10
MARPRKEQMVSEAEEIFSRSVSMVFTDYRGLTNAQLTALRNDLRAKNVYYKVVKNTLANIAADKTKIEGLQEILKGPVAVAYSYESITVAPKSLLDHLKSKNIEMEIKGGFYDGKAVSGSEIKEIASIPSREVLISRVLGGILSPMYGLVMVLNAVKEQKEQVAA